MTSDFSRLIESGRNSSAYRTTTYDREHHEQRGE